MVLSKKSSAGKGVEKAQQQKGKGNKGARKPKHLVAFLAEMEKLYMGRDAAHQEGLADFFKESVQAADDLEQDYKEDPGRGSDRADKRLSEAAEEKSYILESYVGSLVPDTDHDSDDDH
jgi:hypothetical protein